MLTTRIPARVTSETSVGTAGSAAAILATAPLPASASATTLSGTAQPELPYQQRVVIANKDKSKSATILHTVKTNPPVGSTLLNGSFAPASPGVVEEVGGNINGGGVTMVATAVAAAPAAGGTSGKKKKNKNKRGSQGGDADGGEESHLEAALLVAAQMQMPAPQPTHQPPQPPAARLPTASASSNAQQHNLHQHHNHQHHGHSAVHNHRPQQAAAAQHTCNNPAHAHYRPPTPHRVSSPIPTRAATSGSGHLSQNQRQRQAEIPLSDSEYDDAGNSTQASNSAKKKKAKKKKKAADGFAVVGGGSQQGTAGIRGGVALSGDVWYKSDAEEKQRIREFWLQLGEEDRRALVKLEKEAVLRKMKEQQKQTCSCAVCGRKRTVIEEELEILYDAYYEELENFANDHSRNQTAASVIAPRGGHSHHYPRQTPASVNSYVESDEEDDDDEEGDSQNSGGGSIFEFGSSLTVKEGGILTVADDFLKNDGRKFLDLMEQLAERKIRLLEEEDSANGNSSNANGQDWDDGYDDEDDEEYDDEEDSMTEEQRMEEGRRMFQIFAAKMFEQRVLTAYREKVANERQQRLLQELEEEAKVQELQLEAKQKKLEKKKEKKKAVKQQKEEEKLAKEREKAAEDERLREEKEKKQERDRLKREQERLKKEEERLKRDEADRLKREQERLKKEEEKRKQKEAEERRQKQREEKEKEKREKEAKARELAEREAAAKLEAEREAERKLQDERVAAERAQSLIAAQQFVKPHQSPLENTSQSPAPVSLHQQPAAALPPRPIGQMVRPQSSIPPPNAASVQTTPTQQPFAPLQQQHLQQQQRSPMGNSNQPVPQQHAFSNVPVHQLQQHHPQFMGPRPVRPVQQPQQAIGVSYAQHAPPGIPPRIPSNGSSTPQQAVSPPQAIPNQLSLPPGVPQARPLMANAQHQQQQQSQSLQQPPTISPTKSSADLGAPPHLQQQQQQQQHFAQMHMQQQQHSMPLPQGAYHQHPSQSGQLETQSQMGQSQQSEMGDHPQQQYGMPPGVGGWASPADHMLHQHQMAQQRQQIYQQHPISLPPQQQQQQQQQHQPPLQQHHQPLQNLMSQPPPSVTSLPGMLLDHQQQQQQQRPLPIGSKAVGSRPGPGPIGRPGTSAPNSNVGAAPGGLGKGLPIGGPAASSFGAFGGFSNNHMEEYGGVVPAVDRFKDWFGKDQAPVSSGGAPPPSVSQLQQQQQQQQQQQLQQPMQSSQPLSNGGMAPGGSRVVGAIGQLPSYGGLDGAPVGMNGGRGGAFDWDQPSGVGVYSAFGPVGTPFGAAGLQHSLFPPGSGGAVGQIKSVSPQAPAGGLLSGSSPVAVGSKPAPVGGQRLNGGGVIGQGPPPPPGSAASGAFGGQNGRGGGNGWNGYGF